ncbi:MAG: hypothetical protein KBS68_00670 [Clostridiales bacterium]|nr:hypothetical protein [Candidatus Crickella merdequi]
MAKSKGTPSIGKSMTPGLGGAVLRMIAIGLTGGIALIAGANKAGEKIEEYETKHAVSEAEAIKNFDIPLEEIEHYEDK